MNLSDLLKMGITASLDADGGLLLEAPKGALTDELIERIRNAKPGLIAEIRGDREGCEVGELHPSMFSPVGKGAISAATTSRCRRLHFAERDPLEVWAAPLATQAEILAEYPDTVAAEPVATIIRQPTALLTAEEETAIRAWLALIEETDPATIAKVIERCQRDADAQAYFIGRAAECDPVRTESAAQPAQQSAAQPAQQSATQPATQSAQQSTQQCAQESAQQSARDAHVARSCRACRHRRSPGLSAGYCAERTDTAHAYGQGHPLRLLPDDGGAGCDQFEDWI